MVSQHATENNDTHAADKNNKIWNYGSYRKPKSRQRKLHENTRTHNCGQLRKPATISFILITGMQTYESTQRTRIQKHASLHI